MLRNVTAVNPVTILHGIEQPVAGIVKGNPNILLTDVHCWKVKSLEEFCSWSLESANINLSLIATVLTSSLCCKHLACGTMRCQ